VTTDRVTKHRECNDKAVTEKTLQSREKYCEIRPGANLKRSVMQIVGTKINHWGTDSSICGEETKKVTRAKLGAEGPTLLKIAWKKLAW